MGYDPRLVWGEHLLPIGDSESYVHVAVNPVERRIQELANPQQGQRRCYILAVRRKVVIPNLRYSWLLFEHLTDTEHTEPVDTVVLDVDQDEASKIDRQVAQTVKDIWVIFNWERQTRLSPCVIAPKRMLAGKE